MAESKITKTPIQHRPWKVKFSPKITEPNVGLYSVFDLLFYEVTSNGVTVVKKRLNNQPNQSKGLHLDHDLICYNVNFMNGSIVDRATITYDEWVITGFDIGFVEYDRRSKTRLVKVKSPITNKTFEVRIFDKSAALFPDTVEDIFNLNTKYSELIKRDILTRGEASDSTWQSTNYVPFSVNIDSSSERTTDFYLANIDSVFTQTLITKSGFSAYNSFCLNTTDDIRYFVNCLIGYNSGYVKYDNINFTYDDELFPDAKNDIFNIQQSSAKNIIFDETDPTNNEVIIDILKHTYVWLRCGYFGDYINPDDFNQNLDQKANVKFSNLMISSNGDFNRYDDSLSSDEQKYRSESTRPYLVQTAPSEDLLSQVIANQAGATKYDQNSDTNESVVDKVTELMKVSERDDDSVIGALWNETLSRDSDTEDIDQNVDAINHLTPPQYFDPEQVKSIKTIEHSDYVPTLVPKNGNIMTNGRILSPTIDEIWVYFKKLVSGHAPDNTNELLQNADKGLVVNKTLTANENDTRLKEGRELVFNSVYSTDVNGNDYWGESEHKGDPIELEISASNENKKDRLLVKNWVAAPETFKYAIYEFLKSEDEIICKFEEDYNNGDFKVAHSIFNTTASLNNSHYEENESNKNLLKDGDCVKPNDSKYDKIDSKSSDIYSPRSNPYSLRELEAELKNTKYNLNTLMRYLLVNFTINNQLSKRTNQNGIIQKVRVYKIGNSYYTDTKGLSPYIRHLQEQFIDEGFVKVNGSENEVHQYQVLWSDIDFTNRQSSGLYQFHKDYNSKIDAPNTWFNKYSKAINSENGAAAVFDDLSEIVTTDNRKLNESFDQHNNAYDYGKAITLTESSNDYSASDTYLAADGTWRYVFDHTRLPVLKCKY